MKKYLVFATALTLSNAFAGSYVCTGIDEASKKQDEMTIGLDVDSKGAVVNEDGVDIELARDKSSDKSSSTYAKFADNEYDGYGGYVQISVPKGVLKSTNVQKPFTAYYTHETYSEAGKVGVIRLKATCSGS